MQTETDKQIYKIAILVEKNSKDIEKNTQSIETLSILVEKNSKDIEKNSISIADLSQTVEDLAISVKNGFDSVYEKFKEVVTIDVFSERMDRLEFRFNEHDRRIDNLEDKVGLISRKIGLSRK